MVANRKHSRNSCDLQFYDRNRKVNWNRLFSRFSLIVSIADRLGGLDCSAVTLNQISSPSNLFPELAKIWKKRSLLDLALQMFFTALSVLIRCSFSARPTQALEKYLISRAPTERPNANLPCRHRLLSFGLPGVCAYIVVNIVRIRILNSRARLKAQMPNLWN